MPPPRCATTGWTRTPRQRQGCWGCCATSTATSTTTERTPRWPRDRKRSRARAVLPGGAAAAVRAHRAGHRRLPAGADGARVMVEKPFGTDLASAQALNETMNEVFPEDAIYRVDHWLGLDPLENVLFARFANSVIEPLLNRDHVESVQITMAEAFDVVRPGQLLRPHRRDPRRRPEPHAAGAGERARRHARRRAGHDDVAEGEGQVDRRAATADPRGHRQGPVRRLPRRGRGRAGLQHRDLRRGASRRSTRRGGTGVPIAIRAGKCMPVTATEVAIRFRPSPHRRLRRSRPSSRTCCGSASGRRARSG